LRTLGRVSSAALLLQTSEGLAADTGFNTTLAMLARSSSITKVVLLILALFSIASWSIILYKLWAFRRSAGQTASFLDVFRRSNKFSEVQAVCRSLRVSPLVGLFQAGYAELTAQLRQNTSATEGPMANPSPNSANPAVSTPANSNPRGSAGRPIIKSLTAVDRALLRAAAVEVNRLERRVSFLATTASISPFIGLFGTVWGIMSAFQGIGQTGSTNLGVVAPGIAEALIATAAGLFAAIPAVYFYNHLTQRVKLFASEMDDFAMEFLNIAERNFT
jgi:biopolymer transport protein TolQ